MSKLTKGMYGMGTEFRSMSNLFGLRCGQKRRGMGLMIQSSVWYNKAGEKLGFGDLSVKDFQRISKELEDGEIFIVIDGRNSLKGSLGIDYMAEYAQYIITRNQMYCFDSWSPEEEVWEIQMGGLQYKVLKSGDLKSMI